MRLWRVKEAERLVKSELARELAEAWARCGDEQCLADTPFEPELVGVGRWWLGPFTIGNRKMGEIPFFSLPPVSTCPGHTPSASGGATPYTKSPTGEPTSARRRPTSSL